MYNYIFFGIFLSLIAGFITWLVLSSRNKWSDSTIFIAVGFGFGLVLLVLRYFNELWIMNNVNFYFSILAYLTTYYIFYSEFRSKYKNLDIGFGKYIVFMVKNAQVVIKDASVEDALKGISRDIFYSDQMKEITKIWYEDKPERDEFGGWLTLIWNFMLFTGCALFVASQNSLTDLFYSILFSDEMKVLFWGIVIIVIGVIIKAYFDSGK